MNHINRVAIIGECMVELKKVNVSYNKVLVGIHSTPQFTFPV